MDVQKLIDDVERLRALIKSWSAAGPAGALERDLVLEKLRGLYETVLFSEPLPLARSPSRIPARKERQPFRRPDGRVRTRRRRVRRRSLPAT